jgi:3-hydroxyacyl-[acyl-carrier-protein] dehydratase
MPPPAILKPSTVDFTRVLADSAAIRAVNPQRFEMEALTAIVMMDPVTKIAVAYKDVQQDEFWVRGHMPGDPLMPGVMMCEAAAQLCSYYLLTQKVFDSDYVGLGGLDDVQFRHPVRPGDRLVLVARLTRERKFIAQSDVQGFVSDTMVFDAVIKGVPLRKR